jgi:hypothetical protein
MPPAEQPAGAAVELCKKSCGFQLRSGGQTVDRTDEKKSKVAIGGSRPKLPGTLRSAGAEPASGTAATAALAETRGGAASRSPERSSSRSFSHPSRMRPKK